MSEHRQVHCPESDSQEVVDLETTPDGKTCVVWCSKALGRPQCPQSCLKELKSVGSIMLTETPQFQLSELSLLPLDRVLARFQDQKFERLPVLDQSQLVGSLRLSKVALWSDNRAARAALEISDWCDSHDDADGSCWLEKESISLLPGDCWRVATDKLLRSHHNELFVTTKDGVYLGAVYARQLLRIASER